MTSCDLFIIRVCPSDLVRRICRCFECFDLVTELDDAGESDCARLSSWYVPSSSPVSRLDMHLQRSETVQGLVWVKLEGCRALR